MCHWWTDHGRGQIWYENFENYLFNKILPTPEEREEAKRKMVATFAETEWRYSEPEYIRNIDFLKERSTHGFAAQIITKEEMFNSQGNKTSESTMSRPSNSEGECRSPREL